MSPMNVTNLLVKIVAQNNNLNNSANRNVNSQTPQLLNPSSQPQNAMTQQTNAPLHTQNANINLNNNVNNILNQEMVSRQIMNNTNQTQNVYTPASNGNPAQNNLIPQANTLNMNQTVLAQNQPAAQNLTQNTVLNQTQANLVQNQNVLNNQNINQPQTVLTQNQPTVLNQPQTNNLLAQNLTQKPVVNQPQVNNALNNINQQSNVLNTQNTIFNAQNAVLNKQTQINNSAVLKNAVSQNVTSKNLTLAERNQNINYVKDMMKLPQDMKDVLAVLQQTSTAQAKAVDNNRLLLLSNINIKNLTQLIQKGSNEALQQIMTTNQALSKVQLSQLQEAVSYLNASALSQESQTQALKNFMLLYLPWLPLEEGMDFNLDFSFSEGSEEDDENILNIVIMTRNFGEIHILIILKAMNSFEIYIQCCKNFPKRKLLKLIGEEEKKYTMQTNTVFEEKAEFTPKHEVKEAKITLSHVKEISPFLLLIANSIIKNTFLLDAQYSK